MAAKHRQKTTNELGKIIAKLEQWQQSRNDKEREIDCGQSAEAKKALLDLWKATLKAEVNQ